VIPEDARRYARARAMDAISAVNVTNGVFNRSLILSAAITFHCFTAISLLTAAFPLIIREQIRPRGCVGAPGDSIKSPFASRPPRSSPLLSAPIRVYALLPWRTLDPAIVRMRAGRHRRMEMRPLNGIAAVHYRGLLHGTCAPRDSRWAC